MGHFGRKAIGFSWLGAGLSLPDAQLLGQGALLLGTPGGRRPTPSILMAPEWARLPLVVIATAATIIASQAVISGAFSVTHQAVQLGFLPRLQDRAHQREGAGPDLHSGGQLGPAGDGHRCSSSDSANRRELASAYGIAVTGTMLITTVMLGVLVFQVWRWNRLLAAATIGALPDRRRHLFRVEHHQDPRRRLVPAAGRGDQLHRADHLGEGPATDARAARRNRRCRCRYSSSRPRPRCTGSAARRCSCRPRPTACPRRCSTISSTTRCSTSA